MAPKRRPTPAVRKPSTMLSLTPREQLVVLAVLAAVLLGVAVKHWRDARREALPTPAERSAID